MLQGQRHDCEMSIKYLESIEASLQASSSLAEIGEIHNELVAGGYLREKPKKKQPKSSYDLENKKPVIRSSICTGEKTAGFRENGTGRFREVMLISSPADLAAFRERYNITGDIETIY